MTLATLTGWFARNWKVIGPIIIVLALSVGCYFWWPSGSTVTENTENQVAATQPTATTQQAAATTQPDTYLGLPVMELTDGRLIDATDADPEIFRISSAANPTTGRLDIARTIGDFRRVVKMNQHQIQKSMATLANSADNVLEMAAVLETEDFIKTLLKRTSGRMVKINKIPDLVVKVLQEGGYTARALEEIHKSLNRNAQATFRMPLNELSKEQKQQILLQFLEPNADEEVVEFLRAIIERGERRPTTQPAAGNVASQPATARRIPTNMPTSRPGRGGNRGGGRRGRRNQ